MGTECYVRPGNITCTEFEAWDVTTGERLHDFTARNISNTLGHRQSASVERCHLNGYLSLRRPRPCWTVQVYALAIMQINPGDALLKALADEAIKKIGGFIAQNLSNTVW